MIWKKNKIKYSLYEENKYLSLPPMLNGSLGLPTLFLLLLLKPRGGERNAKREFCLFPSSLHTKNMFMDSYLWFINQIPVSMVSVAPKKLHVLDLFRAAVFSELLALDISPFSELFHIHINHPSSNKAPLFCLLQKHSWSRNQLNVYLPCSFLLSMMLFTSCVHNELLHWTLLTIKKRLTPPKCLLQVTSLKTNFFKIRTGSLKEHLHHLMVFLH